MGWLELLPLLKRLLPLLTRVAPMLEGVIVARAGSSKETEAALDRMTGAMKAEFASAIENHAVLSRTLADHAEQVRTLNIDVQRLHTADVEQAARLASLDMQMTALAKSVRTFAAITIVLVALCALLMLLLVLRH